MIPVTDTLIRAANPSDADGMAEIYNHYVAHTSITFEEEPVSASQMAERLGDVRAALLPWFVAEHAGQLAGYAYASRWKGRSAYRFSAESTVYLRETARGQGIGRQLYAALFAELKAKGLHVVIGGIALPNDASIALHEKMGLRKVAHFEAVGFKFGRWIDVGYWQTAL